MVIHAASHFYHEKRVAWVSISMHACDPVPIVMGRRSSARKKRPITTLQLLQHLTKENTVRNVTLRYRQKNPLNFPPLLGSRDPRRYQGT